MRMQAALHLIYPPQCLCCDARVTTDFGLCGDCWRQTPFISGLVCDCCGIPLPGDEEDGPAVCDECLALARPWERARAAMLYDGKARQMVMGLKHADRMDLIRPAARWLHRAAAPLLRPDTLITPVPLHWLRLLKRRYNQAALLASELGRLTKLDHCPDLILRNRYTRNQGGRDRHARFASVEGAFRLHPRRAARIQDRHVLLVDDVLTSGATLAACAEALIEGGARSVDVVVLCRVAREG